jgi:hypothetical protein
LQLHHQQLWPQPLQQQDQQQQQTHLLQQWVWTTTAPRDHALTLQRQQELMAAPN